MRWLRSLACVCGLVLMAGTAAAQMDERLRGLELASVDNPRALVDRSQAQLLAAQQSGDRSAQMWAWCGVMLGEQMLETDVAAQGRAAQMGAALASELRNTELLSVFLIGQAFAQQHDDKSEQALATFDQAIALTTRDGLQVALGRALNQKATVLMDLGRQADALGLLFQAHRLFEAHGERLWKAVTLGNIAVVYMQIPVSDDSHWRKSAEYLRQVLDDIDPIANRVHGATLNQLLGVSHYRLKQPAEARSHWAICHSLALAVKDQVQAAQCDARLARLEIDERRLAEAGRLIEQAHPVFVQSGDPIWLWTTQLLRAEYFAASGRANDSLAALSEAEALTKRLGIAEREAEFHQRAAAVQQRLGHYEQALRHVQQQAGAERRRLANLNERTARELKARFEVRQLEFENETLRARDRQVRANQRAGLLAAVLLSLLAGVAVALLIARQRRLRRQVHEAGLARTRFLSAACHDLNQPTQALNLYLWLLNQEPLPPQAASLLNGAGRCGRELDALVQAMLAESAHELAAQLRDTAHAQPSAGHFTPT